MQDSLPASASTTSAPVPQSEIESQSVQINRAAPAPGIGKNDVRVTVPIDGATIEERIVQRYNQLAGGGYKLAGTTTNGPALHIHLINSAGRIDMYGLDCSKLDGGGYVCKFDAWGSGIVK
jgi:cell wall-associated NlpC family hydrolase